MRHTGNIILTGEPGTGKSNWVMKMTGLLKEKGCDTGGFITPSVPCYLRSYFFTDLATGRTLPLASESAPPGWYREGKFWFNPVTVDEGKRILNDPQNEKHDLIVVDEIGPFELAGRMWSEALTNLLKKRNSGILLVVRESILEDVLRKWKLGDTEILHAGQDEKLLSLI